MRTIISGLIAAALLFPAAAFADDHKGKDDVEQKRIVIKTSDEAELQDLLAEAGIDPSDIDGADFEVIVEQSGGEMGPRMMRRHMRHGDGHGKKMGMGMAMGKMNEDAANCVLKNLARVESDAAAMLLRQACHALHGEAPAKS